MISALVLTILLAPTNFRPSPRTPVLPAPTGICAVLNQSEIGRTLGQPVGEGKQDLTGPVPACTWPGVYGEVTLSIRHSTVPLDIAAELENLKAAIPGATVRPSVAICAPAYILDAAGSGAQLHVVREGRDYLMVSVLGFGNASRAAGIAEELGRLALQRM